MSGKSYKVGYARPPKQHQFKPGRSGNPSGRRRNARNLKTDLAEELAETIRVSEAGASLVLSKQRALVKRLCAQALSGDARAMNQIVALVLRMFPPADDDRAQHDPLEESDAAIIARFLARSARHTKGDRS